ncbi:MAG: two pore domain potassium channel family protein [Corynebacteriales bacterium]|nr:two pore domain potassium channel family protein [Mycobacteriales bacterium]
MLRSLAATIALVVVYYLAPLHHFERVSIGLSLAIALLILLFVAIWQIWAITQATYPGIRAIEALAVMAPLLLLLFATTYFLMAQSESESFNETLTRTDALYFTITVFATVGFGDIVATSENARLLVTVQMVVNVLIIGLGIRVFTGAIQRGREHQSKAPTAKKGD